TRLSLHHFIAPAVPVREMASAVRPGGHIAVIDLLSPVEPGLADRYNHYERLRDPSHTRALTFGELQSVVTQQGLDVIHTDAIEVEVNVERWLALTKTPKSVGSQIVSQLEEEVAHNKLVTGLFPFIRSDGQLMFKQNWVMVLAIKSGDVPVAVEI